MKPFLILILSFTFSITAFAQQDSLGFTNKAEAENKMVNGLQEGKWVIRQSIFNQVPGGSDSAGVNDGYALVIFKHGKPYGIERVYSSSGKLQMEYCYKNGRLNGMRKTYYSEYGKTATEASFLNGKLNGVEKDYYISGALQAEYHFVNDTANGLNKGYYESGALKWEATFVRGEETGIKKEYYENGKLKAETKYSHGVAGKTKNYNGNGNEIK